MTGLSPLPAPGIPFNLVSPALPYPEWAQAASARLAPCSLLCPPLAIYREGLRDKRSQLGSQGRFLSHPPHVQREQN